jgi:hypothetical protein
VPKKDNFYFVETLPSLGSGKLDLKGVKQRATELTNPLSHPEKEV